MTENLDHDNRSYILGRRLEADFSVNELAWSVDRLRQKSSAGSGSANLHGPAFPATPGGRCGSNR